MVGDTPTRPMPASPRRGRRPRGVWFWPASRATLRPGRLAAVQAEDLAPLHPVPSASPIYGTVVRVWGGWVQLRVEDGEVFGVVGRPVTIFARAAAVRAP